ncbi:RHS repeat-associated core domain-containing protein [Dyella sp. 2RAB6]|uniref:RHS repeat-associated core domain-containing protein n=1 Tax=Dyella sp. 2RAB6 TaxID=3232992 RepID=UPI003F8F295A
MRKMRSAGAWMQAARILARAAVASIALAHLPGLTQASPGGSASFRPYADGYWVLSTYDGPPRRYRDAAGALDDAVARWCAGSSYKDCRWSDPREVESPFSDERYVQTHIEYDLLFRYSSDGPGVPVRTLRLEHNSRVRVARSCPAGYVLAMKFGFREENASLYSALDEYTCRASDTIPSARDLGLPDSGLVDRCSATDAALVGNPINLLSLNKIQVVVDIAAAGRSPLHWTRTYNSGAGNDGSQWTLKPQRRYLGSQWRGSYDYSLEASQYYDHERQAYQPAIRLHRPDGAVRDYRLVAGRYESEPDDPGRLEAVPADEGGGWRFFAADDTLETYDAAGLLRTIADRLGRTQRLVYGDAGRLLEVVDAQGRSLRLGYDEAGRVARVTGPGGESVAYRYDEADGAGLDADLVEASYADGSREGYSYSEAAYLGGPSRHPHLLTGRIDALGTRIGSYRYDLYDRAKRSYGAGGAGGVSLRFYTDVGFVNDARDTDRTYWFTLLHGRRRLTRVSQPPGAGCPWAASELGYDGQGRLLTRKNHNGQTTAYGYTDDGRSLERVRIEAEGTPQERTTLTDWHARFRLPTRIQLVPTGAAGDHASATRTLDIAYDEHGNRLTQTESGAGVTALRRWSYTYDEAGRVLSIDGPRTDVADLTRYAYRQRAADGCADDPVHCAYRQGDLWTVTDALGHVTEVLRYDGAGRALSIKDANGVLTDLAYTPRGWLAELRVHGATDAVTRYDYNANGQLVKSTDPDGVSLSYAYDDAHRLVGIQDSAGGRIAYTLNAAGDVTAETLHDNGGQVLRSLARAFDALGRMKTLIGADGERTSFEYDANGNLTQVVRPLRQVWRIQHDALDRVVMQVGGAADVKAMVVQEHDSQDRLVSVTDPNGLTTRYERNGLGELAGQRSPDTGATAQEVDVAGNVVRRTDARGQTRSMHYDALQRLVEMSFDGAPGETIRYAYDQADAACPAGETYAVGRLSRVADASGGTSYCYNASGQRVRKRQIVAGTTLELAYTYTPAGRLASLRYPDGHAAVYTHDEHGRIATIDIVNAKGMREPLVTAAAYLPFGPAVQWRYGNGRTLTRRYDADGRPTGVEDLATDGLAASFGYDANGRLVRLSASASGTSQLSFAYDALDRLVETRDGPTGTVLQRYRYDLTGNRTAFADARGEQVYVYPQDSHRLTAVAGQARTYDAMGNLIADDSRQRQFSYNAMGRMAEVREGASVLQRYAYNAKGERVLKSDGATATVTVYDESGRWLGDYDQDGRSRQQVIWLGDHPVGLIQDGKTYYVESDHLGTPRVVVDPVRDVAVWRWSLKGEVFGGTPPDEDPDRDGAGFVLDMRFPGQRYDPVAGLNYNCQRDYDFLGGRYVQSDPLGLLAGVSTYGYVLNNPLAHADREGLMSDLDTVMDLPSYIGAIGLVNTYRVGRDGLAADQAAESSGLFGGHNGPADAYRHCVWSCLMTQHIGLANAKIVGDMYESNEAARGQDPREKDMDDINNVIGRQCGLLMDGKDCRARCMDAVRNERLLLYLGG